MWLFWVVLVMMFGCLGLVEGFWLMGWLVVLSAV
jgi:hypothetical protein